MGNRFIRLSGRSQQNGLLVLSALLAVAMLALLYTAGCGKTESAPPAQNLGETKLPTTPGKALRDVSLRLKWLYATYFGGPVVAQDKGFFKEYGFNLDVKPGGMQLDPVKLVASGSNTFGVIGADGLLLARAQGIPVVAIAAQEPVSAACFYTLKSSGITQPSQFAGKKVGMFFGNDTETVYKALMRKLRIDRSTISESPAPWDLKPLLEGQLDVYPGYSYDQSMPLTQEGIAFNIIDPHQYGIVFLGNIYFTTEKLIKEDPKLVQGFVSGTIKGWRYAFANADEAVAIVMGHDDTLKKDEQAYYLKACKPFVWPEGREIGVMTDDDWQRTCAILREEGVLKEDLDVKKAFTTEFVDAYYAEVK